MKCLECGAKMGAVKLETIAYSSAGLPGITLKGVPVSVCENGHREVTIPKIDELHKRIAKELTAKPGRLSPNEIRFLRKHLGYQQVDFAKLVGVTAESVSRWESGSVRMADTADRLLRLLVVQRDQIREFDVERLKGASENAQPLRAQIRVSTKKIA